MRLVQVIFLVVSLTLGAHAAKKPAKAPPAMKIAPGQPEIFSMEPRGIQRGVTSKIKLIGTNLANVTELQVHNKNLQGKLLDEPARTATELWIQLSAATNLPRGGYDLTVKNTNAESSKIKVHVDDLPQVYLGSRRHKEAEAAPNRDNPSLIVGAAPLHPPFSAWGTLVMAGKPDEVSIQGRRGEILVFDVAAKSIGSKANVLISLWDAQGRMLASNGGFDGGDPLLDFRVPENGTYKLHISEKNDASSKEHFYRVSVGSLSVVTGCFPLGVPANHDNAVALLGVNLPADSRVNLKARAPGEMDVPIDPEKFRSRLALKVLVDTGPELIESEPNDTPDTAMPVPIPCTVDGRIFSYPSTANSETSNTHLSRGSEAKAEHATRPDIDIFKFHAQAGRKLVIETDAARRGSPLDTKIEVLHPDGKPVERVLLQGVRDSHITFKNIDSNTDDLRVENWQEMELNQLMYLQGEVCKIFRMPQGPDSGFQFYNAGGKRLDYFDTSAVAHALDEPAYVVEPHPPDTKLLPNGLPVFTIDYANDDDATRKRGSDSYLLFDPPRDGDYLVRITDSRGFGGDRFAYRLTIRDANPDFNVVLAGANPTVNAGSGKEFTVSADRRDGFDGDITVEFTNVPPGILVSTPIVIQSGHLEAKGTINVASDATMLFETNAQAIKATARALVDNHPITRDVNSIGKIKIVEKSKLLVALEPYDQAQTNFVERGVTNPPLEITIAPGQIIPAWLKVKRNGFDEIVTFTVDDLPHGVIVDNIGLNGVLIPKGQTSRQIFLSAAKWVPDTDRLCFAKAAQAEGQTSSPVLLHVRRQPLHAAK